MKMFLALGPIGSLCLAGCSVHPLPENFEHDKTPEIVSKIRCEARRAIQDIAIEKLKGSSKIANRDLGFWLSTHRDEFVHFDRKRLQGKEAVQFYDEYVASGIAFNFTFDITEQNHNDTSIDPVRVLTNGTVGVSLSAKAYFDRQTNRHFIVSDTFGGLLDDHKLISCPDKSAGSNFPYPITGDVGLREVIGTFIDLNQSQPLGELSAIDSSQTTDVSSTANRNSPVMAETLKFTTTFEGTVNPSVMINAPAGGSYISTAGFTSDHTRTDLNTLILGLSYEPRAEHVATKHGDRKALALDEEPPLSVFAPRARSAAAKRALNATIQQQYDTFLQTFSQTIRQVR